MKNIIVLLRDQHFTTFSHSHLLYLIWICKIKLESIFVKNNRPRGVHQTPQVSIVTAGQNNARATQQSSDQVAL